MIPYFFGSSEPNLFACYHAPVPAQSSGSGVLICYPIGHEYIRCHRLLRQLTKRLNRQGLHVLRFDYYGTGDSAGNFNEVLTDRWVGDIQVALDEFHDMAGVSQMTVLGLRLGCNLVVKALQDSDYQGGLVLFDPIIDIPGYFSELSAMQELMMTDLGRFGMNRQLAAGYQHDLLGFKYTSELLNGLLRMPVDFSSVQDCRFIFSKGIPADLSDRGISDACYIDLDCKWDRLEFIETGVIAPELIDQIISIVAS